MFLRKLKNIYVSVNHHNLDGAVKHASELRNILRVAQSGGNRAFEQLLKKDLDPTIKKLELNKKYSELLLQIINFIIDYVEKLKIDDVETLSGLLKEMRFIIQTRLEKEQN